jgi:threonylcarbamoyladenosine tRNA methylthiotransferase MtaB
VPWQVRKERGRVLKASAQQKKAEFRRNMIGRTLSAVTLGNGDAITSNYLAVELASPREPKQLIDVRIGTATDAGLREYNPLAILA